MSDGKDLDANDKEPVQDFQSTNTVHKEDSSICPNVNEEEIIKKKYGGFLPKKPPLISKDHERAFFDSADWALGKQGAHGSKPKGPLQALRPKLQPTPHQEVRSRSAYAPVDGDDAGHISSEDPNSS